MEDHIELLRALGLPCETAEHSMRIMEGTLRLMIEHQQLIMESLQRRNAHRETVQAEPANRGHALWDVDSHPERHRQRML